MPVFFFRGAGSLNHSFKHDLGASLIGHDFNRSLLVSDLAFRVKTDVDDAFFIGSDRLLGKGHHGARTIDLGFVNDNRFIPFVFKIISQIDILTFRNFSEFLLWIVKFQGGFLRKNKA